MSDCPECASSGFSRRRFLTGAAGTIAAATMLGGLESIGNMQVAFAEPGYTGDVLIVVSLRGGMDGLSAVVPAGDPHYLPNRPTIGVQSSQLYPLDSMFGLHPALAPLESLWVSGDLALVHAVGQVDMTMSHFEAMEEMERAAPGSDLRTGWIDRMAGMTGPGTPFAATSVGPTMAPQSMGGSYPDSVIQTLSSYALSGATSTDVSLWHTTLKQLQHDGPALVREPAMTTLAGLHTAETLSSKKYQPAGGASYPSNDVGQSLETVAQLLKGDVGVRVVAVDCDDWDMHVGLGSPTEGWMHDNLTGLAQAFKAFATDMGSAMSNIVVVTLSEFGRRIQENGSGGLDHGHGNAVFVMGGGINGRKVYGDWPGLADADQVDGNLKGTTDYRSIIAEILEKRCGITTSDVFPGLGKSRLGLAKIKVPL